MARFAVRSRECRAHGALQKARAREVGARMMTGRKFLRPPLLALAPQSRECRVRGNCSFFPIWPAAVLFQANLARLTKSTRAGSCAATDDNIFLSPPLLWLAPQSDHGSAACAETEAFLQYGPPQSFAEPGSPYKKNVRGKLAQGLMTGRKVLSPPALGACSAIRSRERRARGTEAFFPYGPPQSFFELSWLAGKLAQGLMTGRKVLSPSWLAPQSDHGSAARAETEAFFPIWPAAIFFRVKLACPTKSTRAGSWRNDDDRAQISKPPPSYGSLRNPITGVACAETEAFFQSGPPQSFFELSWLALQKARQGANF